MLLFAGEEAEVTMTEEFQHCLPSAAQGQHLGVHISAFHVLTQSLGLGLKL